MAVIDKRALVQALRDEVAKAISVLTRAANDAREAATHEENKPENDKDTRAIEAGYLAGAQADRARELERVSASFASLDLRTLGDDAPISSGALIELDLEGVSTHYFLAPQGGGMRAALGGVEVQVITPVSPLGRELLGKRVGDVVELTVQKRKRSYEVVTVV